MLTFAAGLAVFIAFRISTSVYGDSVFNYEIGARIQDKISSFTYLVSEVLDVPYMKITKNLVDVSSIVEATRSLFFVEKLNYVTELANLYVGLENGDFFDYATDKYRLNISFARITNRTSNTPTRRTYSVRDDGYPLELVKNSTYNVRKRPWYVNVKASRQRYWTAPYIDAASGNPVISLIYPLLNFKLDGKILDFAGAVCADVYLTAFSAYLRTEYSNTDRNAFIYDIGTKSLMGSSMTAMTYRPNGSKKDLQPALESENSIIAGATALLTEKNWPNELLIYGTNYLQSTRYVDKITGLEWYVVVLLPAILQPDHLGDDSPLYSAVLAVACITTVVAMVCGVLTLAYWHSKTMKLTQPIFTILVISGNLLLCAATFNLLGSNTLSACTGRVFLFNIAFTLSFAPLLIKSWRVHVLFNLNPMAKKQLISNLQLTVYTLVFVSLDVVLVVVTVFAAGRGTSPFSANVLTDNGAYSQLTYCGYHDNNGLLYGEISFKGLMIAIACYLSFKTRNVVGEIGGSKAVLAIVYNTAFICLVIIAITQSISDVRFIIVCQAVGICFCVMMTSTLLVAPVVYQILLFGDKAAAESVINEVFSQNAKASMKTSVYNGDGRAASMVYSNVSRIAVQSVTETEYGGGGGGSVKERQKPTPSVALKQLDDIVEDD